VMGMFLARAVGRSTGASSGSVWQAVRAYIQGRQARLFERERRVTLVTVPQALPPGTRIVDRRADGSVLVIDVPQGLRAEVAAGHLYEPGQLWPSSPMTCDGRSVASHGSPPAPPELNG
jgi:hypothetical protein